MRAIGGFTALLADECGAGLSERGREYLAFVNEGSRKLSAMLEGLVDLGQFARQPITLETVAMAELATSVADDHRVAPPASLTVGPLPSCVGDERFLQRVWRELITNAIKFSRPVETPVIRIDAVRADDGRSVAYRVADNGIGLRLDARTAARLFRPLQRLHGQEHFGGIGIGLSIVRRIVRRLGGDVTLASEPGRGTTVTFTLPAAHDEPRSGGRP